MWNPFRAKRPDPAPASRPGPTPQDASPPLPSAEVDTERYRGRPLLMLLENYVLAAIGELPPDRSAGVGGIVRKMWGGGDDWMGTLRGELGLEDSMDEDLRGMWARNQAIARENGVDLHPVQFAKMVADQNFAPLIDRLS